MSFIDLPVLDLNQNRFLSSVRVRTTWEAIKDCDYCKVGDWFYSVKNVFMSSGDVAELSLIPDFITSAGGPIALEILDGVTNRVHVSDDSYGLYTENDPYMQPAAAMRVLVDSVTGDFSGYESETFLESTIDLMKVGEYGDSEQPGISAYDADGNFVTYPTVDYIPGNYKTLYSSRFGGTSKILPTTTGQVLYHLITNTSQYQTVAQGIANVRSLGIEQCLSGQFQIPENFIDPASSTAASLIQQTLIGKGGTYTCSGVPFVYSAPKNTRVMYGSQTPYTLLSAAGESIQCNAEEIYGGSSNPQVISVADPRREGKPYFRFNPLNGSDAFASGKSMDFFRGAVGGRQWRSVPMVFTDRSGGLLERAKFNNSRNIDLMAAQANYDLSEKQAGEQYGLAKVGTVNNFLRGDALGFGMQNAAADYAYENSMQGLQNYANEFNARRSEEARQFDIQQSVNVPDVNFPLTPDLAVDMSNNGFLVTRVVYREQDVARIDKILTAYGYKHTKLIDTQDFVNRRYFNYVDAQISVGLLPSWWADGIAAQFKGVRIWHVKPSNIYYVNNPIV